MLYWAQEVRLVVLESINGLERCVMSPIAVLDDIIIPITVDYLEEDQIFQVSCPWLQGCHAWGETLDEAMRAIPGNIRSMIEARRQKGSSVPPQLEGIDSKQHFTLRMVPA